MNIYEKLIAIQNELKAPKSKYNSFGKYNYRSCEDILEAAKPLCAKYKAVLMVSDSVEQVGDRFYIKATAELFDAEGDGDVCTTALAREDEDKKGMDGSQITGTASSYARKYALNGLFCIDDTKDADTDEYKRTTEDKAKDAPGDINKVMEKFNANVKKGPTCENCGEMLSPYIGKAGDEISVDEHKNLTLKHYGKVLCVNCCKKIKVK